MIVRTGRILTIRDGLAEVAFLPAGSCGHCISRTACACTASVRLDTAGPPVPGETIEVVVAPGALLRAAALAYLVPVLGLILGAALLAPHGNVAAALGAALGLAAGLAATPLWRPVGPVMQCYVTETKS